MRFVLAMVCWLGWLAAASAANWYVATNLNGDGSSWALATNSIQGMIDDSRVVAGDTVWVSNGVYDVGGVTNFPAGTILTNRIAINKAITVRSTNGPAVTTIKGAWDPATNGPAAVRCVYMVNNSSLIGFTLTNGATLTTGTYDRYGGGIQSPSANTIISNCVLSGNSAIYGGGAYWGTLYNCTLSSNSATYGGGAIYGALYNCTLVGNSAGSGGGTYDASSLTNCTLVGNSAGVNGGGAYAGTLNNCTIVSNSATSGGGGAMYSYLNNCVLSGNSAGTYGGGANYCILYNCALSGNSVGTYGGGANNSTLTNCTLVGNSAGYGGGAYAGTHINGIIYFNSAPNGSNWAGAAVFTNSCTTTAAVGWAAGNITADPSFMANGSGYGTNHVAGNYRLTENSPCLDAGTNFSWMTNPNDVRSRDLDRQPRIRYQIVDMGAYEVLLEGTIFYFR